MNPAKEIDVNKPDLFGGLPTAKAAPKSDTPMLLAMDPDYVTGAQPEQIEDEDQ